MENYLRVGVITSPHGVHGEVKVFPTTDDPSRFLELETVLLDLGGGNERKELTIRQVRFFKNLVILGFEGITSRDQAVELSEDENFIADLIGLSVRTDEGCALGTVTDVIQTGANDVYCVSGEDGKEILLPAIKDCILKVDLEKQEMLVHVLPGLLDL